ncbi:hypothetical protein OG252_12935 [Streptomyces sp. NBC_01352]|uniref:hypothetical protein n=1 Tax=Streptomyces sp. NBC_01352 TaxID=2903834 RepID=UPI002E32BEB3|nr:hypothetical protein [Streptomyces sp. NBC_01352]
MKFCQRCDQPRNDEDVDTIDNLGPTGAGSVVHICKTRCTPVPTQTSPVSRPEPIREG